MTTFLSIVFNIFHKKVLSLKFTCNRFDENLFNDSQSRLLLRFIVDYLFVCVENEQIHSCYIRTFVNTTLRTNMHTYKKLHDNKNMYWLNMTIMTMKKIYQQKLGTSYFKMMRTLFQKYFSHTLIFLSLFTRHNKECSWMFFFWLLELSLPGKYYAPKLDKGNVKIRVIKPRKIVYPIRKINNFCVRVMGKRGQLTISWPHSIIFGFYSISSFICLIII